MQFLEPLISPTDIPLFAQVPWTQPRPFRVLAPGDAYVANRWLTPEESEVIRAEVRRRLGPVTLTPVPSPWDEVLGL